MPHPLAQHLDFANHHATATPADIETLCTKVKEYGFHAAFVNACYITLAKQTGVRVGTVISFPLGQDTMIAKITAVNEAVQLGADELDVVPNIGTFLAGNTDAFAAELKEIVDSAHMPGRPIVVKFILDPGYFDALPNKKEQMQATARAIKASGADYVKIGSGMGPRGPSVEDVAIVREAVGPDMKIKVAGGIDTKAEAEACITAGAVRIGTSHAIEIVTQP
ncbi:deoxyribose-phosphate aldolase [Candidatus Gottesmanbacteria bacterium RIFOXYB1_FULL_47_11]|uniref:Deoxyribose-phosphate aldolase n=1 Tax=Candidatus Gottesmanbacteria bacterium RIFOXYB1_FULL_47_11 TaxID=1798401 RepID=A0A1F6BFC0_9BACT|nr:MAG: deoxyribose-phosphate aldolase [Candidatus Gottesmanbacteria bacterium RIFOXYB1_FULL_47_11]